MVKRKKERSDGRETREAILNAAEEEFASKGFELASLRAICARAGVNVSLVSRYFESKENLYRLVAERLFGDLSRPMTELPGGVSDTRGWRDAVCAWIDDFLYMTIPDAKRQKRCAGLFRQEVTRPTKFHPEFKRRFGKPVFDSLARLLAFADLPPGQARLWATFVWSQVSVYALADKKWLEPFRPESGSLREWRAEICAFICDRLFESLSFSRIPDKPAARAARRNPHGGEVLQTTFHLLPCKQGRLV